MATLKLAGFTDARIIWPKTEAEKLAENARKPHVPFLLIGLGTWGSGNTLAEAAKNLRGAGYRKGPVVLYRFGPTLRGATVDGMGCPCWWATTEDSPEPARQTYGSLRALAIRPRGSTEKVKPKR